VGVHDAFRRQVGFDCLWHASHVSTILPLAAISSSKFLPLAAFMALIAASDIA